MVSEVSWSRPLVLDEPYTVNHRHSTLTDLSVLYESSLIEPHETLVLPQDSGLREEPRLSLLLSNEVMINRSLLGI